jgi:predicted amidophosphoribosyltransferase
MADRFNALIQERMEEVCENNVQVREDYAYATALYFYRADSGYSHISRQLKYHGNIPAGKFFGRQLGLRLAQAEHLSDVDAVIPIPLHWTRKWSRGYNQAEVIAREVATTLGVALRTDILERSRRTRTQTKLSIEGKAANVQGAFRVRPDLLDRFRITDPNNDLSPTTHKQPQPCSPKADVSDPTGLKHLLLIDDVFTTGSTLMACYVALREVFPPSVRISVATLAFVGEP